MSLHRDPETGEWVVSTKVTSQDPPAPGRHRLRIETAEIKETGPNSKNPGEPMMVCRLRVTEGPAQGKAIFANFMIDDENPARFRFEQLCQALDVANRESFAITHFVGGEFDAEIEHDTYDGQTRGQLKKIYVDGMAPSGVGSSERNYPF